jgi:peroxiredoxin family protein
MNHTEPPTRVEASADVLERLAALERAVKAMPTEDRLSIVVFSYSLDRMLAAFTLASTGAASGMDVHMFFTFWGLSALRDRHKRAGKDLLGRLFDWTLPRGLAHLPLSQLDFGGLGRMFFRAVMRKKGIASLDQMLESCANAGVHIWACDMSREVLGIVPGELIDYPHLGYCGAMTFLEKAAGGRVTLFI